MARRQLGSGGGVPKQIRLMKYEFIFRDRGREVIRSAERKSLLCLVTLSSLKRSALGKQHL